MKIWDDYPTRVRSFSTIVGDSLGYDVEAGVWSKYRGSSLVRPAQLAQLSRNENNPELCSHSAYSVFCDILDKITVFNILRQNGTNFDIGNG